MTRRLESGATVPPRDAAIIVPALNAVAAAHNVDAAAIAAIIHTESVWDTRCVTGRYIGLTQVGPDFVESLRLTRDQFLRLSAVQQIEAYGKWLDYYRFNAQMARDGIDVASQPLERQAAVLQAMQFAPNARAWKQALARGDYTVRSTTTQQARFLGDTSIGDMASYYAGFFRRYPPVYAAALLDMTASLLPAGSVRRAAVKRRKAATKKTAAKKVAKKRAKRVKARRVKTKRVKTRRVKGRRLKSRRAKGRNTRTSRATRMRAASSRRRGATRKRRL